MSVVHGIDRRAVKWKSQLLVFTGAGDLVEENRPFFFFFFGSSWMHYRTPNFITVNKLNKGRNVYSLFRQCVFILKLK